MDRTYERYYRIIRRIPKGRVATYGQIAALAGVPQHARQVGYALHALPGDGDVPWHRVINAQGRISQRSRTDHHHDQRTMLENEGIIFTPSGVISLTRYQWRSRIAPRGNRR